MPRFSELDEEFVCPYRNGCPYLEGLPAKWVWDQYAQSGGLECQYEYQLKELNQQLSDSYRQSRELEREKGGSGLRYSFDITSHKTKYEVGVDAKTGTVLENAREGAHPD